MTGFAIIAHPHICLIGDTSSCILVEKLVSHEIFLKCKFKNLILADMSNEFKILLPVFGY